MSDKTCNYLFVLINVTVIWCFMIGFATSGIASFNDADSLAGICMELVALVLLAGGNFLLLQEYNRV